MIDWHDAFDYREGKLYWKVKPNRRILVGSEVGCLDFRDYLVTRFKGKNHKVHRIIFEMFYGPIPMDYQIDHINGNRNDNRIENLRLATKFQNKWNTCRPKRNTSGFKGVSFHKSANKWRVEIRAFGKAKYIGLFSTAEEAYAARLAAEQKMHGEFAPTEKRKLAV